jgi:phage shock protein PspC (stress-responsive transcriptional regulator)
MADHTTDDPARGRIRRDTRNGMIGGVAAGFARHVDIDVVWVRLAFVVATVLGGGLGIVLYVAAWLIVPEGEASDAVVAGPRAARAVDARGSRFWTGVALVALGGVILLDNVLSPLTTRIAGIGARDLILPLVLIGVGALIYRSSRTDEATVARFERDAEALGARIERDAETLGARIGQRVEAWGEEVELRAEQWEAHHEARAAELREARSRSRVAPITFGTASMTLGGLWLASSLGVPGITLARALAATLLVIGVGLVAGAFLGRGRGLIVTGLLLASVVAVTALLPVMPHQVALVSVGEDGVAVGEAEQLTVAPSDLGEVPDTYEFGVGRVVVDLRGLTAEVSEAGTVRLEVAMGVGDLRILLPEGVAVDVAVDVGIGRVEVLGASSGGIGVSRTRSVPAEDDIRGLLVLEVSHGIGNVTVTR